MVIAVIFLSAMKLVCLFSSHLTLKKGKRLIALIHFVHHLTEGLVFSETSFKTIFDFTAFSRLKRMKRRKGGRKVSRHFYHLTGK